jgi:hypothetical protein
MMLGWKLANWQVLSVLIPKMQLNWNDASLLAEIATATALH